MSERQIMRRDRQALIGAASVSVSRDGGMRVRSGVLALAFVTEHASSVASSVSLSLPGIAEATSKHDLSGFVNQGILFCSLDRIDTFCNTLRHTEVTTALEGGNER